MSKDWKNGDVIYASDMNRLENKSLIVTFNGDTGYTNQTWTEIKTALLAGKTVYLDDGYDFLAFAAANGLHDDDTSKISIYFRSSLLGIDGDTGCLYFLD